jgi:membrane-bound serine protease (ClpP class)
VLLILLAAGLFAAEIKVPAYGLLTVSGIIAMILGALMLVDSGVPGLQVSLRTVIPAALLMALWITLVVRLVLRAQNAPVVTGAQGMIGATAVAESDLAPTGWVLFRGAKWRARAESPVKAGETVTVAAVEGLTVHVRKEA